MGLPFTIYKSMKIDKEDIVVRTYEFGSVPLRRVLRPKVGDLIYTSYGEGFICEEDSKESFKFKLVHDTVLKPGNLIEDLSKAVLEYLFWPLTRTELNKTDYEIKRSN